MIVHDNRRCELGEGAFWHPLRRQFFWFDILDRRLLWDGGERSFDRMASAAGVIDQDRLIVATETGLAVLDLRDNSLRDLAPIEADDPGNRSNDGRADRQGGFWIGTMGKQAEPGRGAIYRYFRGTVRRVVEGLGIPNAICFSADGTTAFYADTAARQVWAQPVDAEGWPQGPRRSYLDLSSEGLDPDGAVIDAEGGFCCAIWGRGQVMRFDREGRQTHAWPVGGLQSTCPAFGGDDMQDLLVTTALQGLDAPDVAQGLTYRLHVPVRGLAEPWVIL
ncbi:SMP-30/gluconolactonase/LRE family protein [Paracoccus sp. (in: a-proteobacteria)]|uniref:SMP-30/gluconolactonase/LRE family protein n=1 Tax=Paracoccus sp. TaxID=267 RepID=UPI00396CF74F